MFIIITFAIIITITFLTFIIIVVTIIVILYISLGIVLTFIIIKEVLIEFIDWGLQFIRFIVIILIIIIIIADTNILLLKAFIIIINAMTKPGTITTIIKDFLIIFCCSMFDLIIFIFREIRFIIQGVAIIIILIDHWQLGLIINIECMDCLGIIKLIMRIVIIFSISFTFGSLLAREIERHLILIITKWIIFIDFLIGRVIVIVTIEFY